MIKGNEKINKDILFLNEVEDAYDKLDIIDRIKLRLLRFKIYIDLMKLNKKFITSNEFYEYLFNVIFPVVDVSEWEGWDDLTKEDNNLFY